MQCMIPTEKLAKQKLAEQFESKEPQRISLIGQNIDPHTQRHTETEETKERKTVQEIQEIKLPR